MYFLPHPPSFRNSAAFPFTFSCHVFSTFLSFCHSLSCSSLETQLWVLERCIFPWSVILATYCIWCTVNLDNPIIGVKIDKNSSKDEIVNVNFYAVRPGSYPNSLK